MGAASNSGWLGGWLLVVAVVGVEEERGGCEGYERLGNVCETAVSWVCWLGAVG